LPSTKGREIVEPSGREAHATRCISIPNRQRVPNIPSLAATIFEKIERAAMSARSVVTALRIECLPLTTDFRSLFKVSF
jgi:hypothetical protein